MFSLVAPDLAIDLGTANTLIYARRGGIVLNEPSVVAVKLSGKRYLPLAFGHEAKAMLGKNPEGVKVIRPVRTGVIADYHATGLMLEYFLKKVIGSNPLQILKPRVIVGVPSGITEVEKRAIKQAIQPYTREVQLLDEAMASAIGADLAVDQARANMTVDIGGGTTDIAVISLGDVVQSHSILKGGDAFDEAIINYTRRNRQLLIGQNTAEQIKIAIGSVHPETDSLQYAVKGRSLISGFPDKQTISGEEVRKACKEVTNAIVAAVRHTLESTPPELAGDIARDGILLSGGGSMMRGIDLRLAEELQIKVRRASDPISAVVLGAGKFLKDAKSFDQYRKNYQEKEQLV